MNTDPQDQADITSRVILKLLKPLVRFLIARNVTARAATQLLRAAYVDVSRQDLTEKEGKATDSRIALVTGLPRPEIRKLRLTAEGARDKRPQLLSATAVVLGRWLADPRYRDVDGVPLTLPVTDEDGPDLEELISHTGLDVRGKTLKDEMVSQGMLEEVENGLVRLKPDFLSKGSDSSATDQIMSDNVSSHLAAAVENVLKEDGAKNLERAVYYNRLSKEAVAEIEDEARRLSNDALVHLNSLAFERQKEDKEHPENREIFRFGVYFHGATGENTKEGQGDED
jgi:uncharacterized protein YbjQ (UPF0145 family)